MLVDYIEKEKLTIKYILNTHPHIDHVLGNDFCKRIYHVPLLAHEEGMPIIRTLLLMVPLLAFLKRNSPHPIFFLKKEMKSFSESSHLKYYIPPVIVMGVSLWLTITTSLFLPEIHFLKVASVVPISQPVT
jgi:mRNA degradation ribonuclease J1/J2